MQKQTVLAALAALAAFACTAALAQAPANNTARPPSEVNPTASGGVAASAAQNKVDQRASRSTAAPADPAAGNGRAAPVAEINPSAAGGKAAAKADSRSFSPSGHLPNKPRLIAATPSISPLLTRSGL